MTNKPSHHEVGLAQRLAYELRTFGQVTYDSMSCEIYYERTIQSWVARFCGRGHSHVEKCSSESDAIAFAVGRFVDTHKRVVTNE